MPFLEINSCTECPFARYSNSCEWGEDSYGIKCGHDNSFIDEYQSKRTGRSYGIFFKCPLPQEIPNEDED